MARGALFPLPHAWDLAPTVNSTILMPITWPQRALNLFTPDRLIYLTDVAGVLDGRKVLKAVSADEVEDLIRRHTVSGGMILKLEACKRALAAGVNQVRIVGGAKNDGLLSAANGGKGRAPACFPHIRRPRRSRPEIISRPT